MTILHIKSSRAVLTQDWTPKMVAEGQNKQDAHAPSLQ